MLSTTGPQIAVAWCRRALGAAAAAAALSLAVPQAAQAIVKGFEPMEGIKGKDYGKERQRYPGSALSDVACNCGSPRWQTSYQQELEQTLCTADTQTTPAQSRACSFRTSDQGQGRQPHQARRSQLTGMATP